jgi:hypothetical protein
MAVRRDRGDRRVDHGAKDLTSSGVVEEDLGLV